jgi:hypothetical protein
MMPPSAAAPRDGTTTKFRIAYFRRFAWFFFLSVSACAKMVMWFYFEIVLVFFLKP